MLWSVDCTSPVGTGDSERSVLPSHRSAAAGACSHLVIRRLSRNDGEPRRRGIDGERRLRRDELLPDRERERDHDRDRDRVQERLRDRERVPDRDLDRDREELPRTYRSS
ncbi:hypothetical protein FJT64_022443 [Amphibalanus amphitrite]|uniref:Uncharacterized protein n=1 Tax=Amphibalanus amphitrite TaxID=1232801 RepID=A0A6A4WEB0_AMPAM|nr:hypothetical protein FJT64_022443 [Amphibalanus amphitrite]